jgi:signal transduction histidine kinase
MPAPAEPRRRGVLAPLSAAAAQAALSPPRLPAAALAEVALARQAAALAVPVRLDVPVAGGRTLLARALHAQSGRAGPLVVAEGRCRALRDLPAGASVLIDAETLTVPAAAVVESLLDDGSAWLLLGAPSGACLPAAVAARFDAVTVCVPPLRSRGAELPDLARHLCASLRARRDAAPPVLTDAALAWLTAQPWPGDVGELEATLARAMLRVDGPSLDLPHLTDTAPPALAAGGRHHDQLEFLVAQLAHELRNPLTAVRTFAQLPGLADDPALRERFSALTDEAVGRMDGLLENATAFARLGAPSPATVELAALLDGLVAEVRPALAERAITLAYASPNGARCTADREQLAYALRNVLAGVAREARPEDAVRIDAAAPGVVRVDFDDRHGTAGQLRRAVLGDTDASDVLALPFTLARAVLERNGGGLAVRRQPDGRALLEMRLPGSLDGG